MAHFVDRKGSYYIYLRDGNEYTIHREMLCALFQNYGSCVDPGDRSPTMLSPASIIALRDLARGTQDMQLLQWLELGSKDVCGSSSHAQIVRALMVMLDIGLYLGGWRGPEEPYIMTLRPVSDHVRCELKIRPYLELLYESSSYILIKHFPIVGYSQDKVALKPRVAIPSRTVAQILNRIEGGVVAKNKYGAYLITTAYYYITTIYASPVPMVEPLVQTLVLSLESPSISMGT
jgi:hypothetical protein